MIGPKIKISSVLLFTLTFFSVHAQVYSDKVVGQKHEGLSDSIKASEYPYMLPIWGKKVTKLGFDLTYSAGFSSQYVWQRSDIVINNLSVGFNNGPLHDLDDLIRFNSAVAETKVINVRPDVWVFPFLNVYGIFAKSNSSTAIDFSIWLPGDASKPDGDWQEAARFQTKAEFKSNTTVGFGLTPTIGIGGGWMALDMNFSWTDVGALDKPAYVFNFGPRFGKSFRLKKPERNVAIWIGGFRVKFANATSGSLPLADFMPGDEMIARIGQAQQKVTEADQKLNAWWNGLSNVEQNNPLNKAKYETATDVINRTAQFLENAETAAGNLENSTVQYNLDKKVKDMWNFIVGSQFQLNKHWMLRVEYGFLGSRTQFIGGLQYRFGL